MFLVRRETIILPPRQFAPRAAGQEVFISIYERCP